MLFQGMWIIADREGRLEDRPRRIQAQVMPYDQFNAEAMVQALADRGFLVRYEVGGEKYLQIVNWHKHQSPHPKEAESHIPPVPTPESHVLNSDLTVTSHVPASVKQRDSNVDARLDTSYLLLDTEEHPTKVTIYSKDTEDTKPTSAPKARGVGDNFTPFVERCWQKYPRDSEGRQCGSKKQFVTQVRGLSVTQWDDFEQAVDNYGQSARVKRGYVKAAESWVKLGMWQNYVGSAEPREVINEPKQQRPETRYTRTTEYFRQRAAEAAALGQDDAGIGSLPPGTKPS